MEDADYLRVAIGEAEAAAAAGEVPVGAVLVLGGEVVGRGQNRVIRDSDPTAHAEVVALRAAGQAVGNYRLEGCTLYATLEPCAMCAGAILHARVERLVYAAGDPKAGACGSVLGVLNHPALNHRVIVEAGLLGEECGALLSEFFRSRRVVAANARKGRRIVSGVGLIAGVEDGAMATKKWSAKVDTDETHPDHGLFLEDAESVAKALASKKVSPKGPASGMRMLTFYINRAGKNLPEERVKELEKAKTILSGIIAEKKPAAKKGVAKKAFAKKAAKKPAKKAAARNTPAKKA